MNPTVRALRSGEHADEILIFQHLPKTGGSTLLSILEREYPGDALFAVGIEHVTVPERAWEGLAPEARRRVRCIAGHMWFGLHRHLGRPAAYMTMLRHPVDRIVSHYYHVARSPGHYLHEAVTSRRMTLEDYASSDLSLELANDQTRELAGAHGDDAGAACGSVTRRILELAKQNIRDHFVAVGLTERFDESLALFQRCLGWTNVSYEMRNVGANRPGLDEIPREALGAIEAHNEVDLDLYEFAKKHFEEMLREEHVSRKSLKCGQSYPHLVK